jgi:hypothetical protein
VCYDAGETGSIRVEPGRHGFNSVWTRVNTGETGSMQLHKDPVRNPAVCDCSINHHAYSSFSQGSNPDRDYECHSVCNKDRCRFTLRIEAGRCSSNRFNIDLNTVLKFLQKILNMTQKVFSPYHSHGILRNYNAGETGSIRF